MQYCNTFDVGMQCADLLTDVLLNGERDDGDGDYGDRTPFRLNMERATCVVAKLHGGMHFLYGLFSSLCDTNRLESDSLFLFVQRIVLSF